jgi:hypothetical protein
METGTVGREYVFAGIGRVSDFLPRKTLSPLNDILLYFISSHRKFHVVRLDFCEEMWHFFTYE